MTKGRAVLTSAAVTEGWTERPPVIRVLHPLGGPQAHHTSLVEMTNFLLKKICHPDRSVPGFPATRHSPTATCAAFCKESRMKFANATNLDRKSGGA